MNGSMDKQCHVTWAHGKLTPALARVTLSREKCLERVLSLLNFSRERVTAFFTSSFSKSTCDGQSGQSSATLAAGTVHRDERGLEKGDHV